MEFGLSPAEERFRDEVRTWLHENAPREPRPHDGPAMRDFDLAWQQRKYEGGWAGIAWPREYGGRGLTLVEQMIWYEECARAGAPSEGALGIALNHAGPTVIAFGTPEQKAFHLPRILRGEVLWCQGFSEPGAGSDLASLRTRAVVEGDHLVVTGQKVWTSHAHLADYQELLVRTGPTSPKHKGITWVICDMRTPGITVRPIRTMADNHHYCEVFYDSVRIPLANVVGRIDDGWRVAMSTLAFERGTLAVGRAAEFARLVDALLDLARERTGPDGRRPAIRDEEIAGRIATLRAEAAALRAMTCETVSRAIRGEPPGPESAMDYLFYAEILQRARRLALDLLGPEALETEGAAGAWTVPYLADRMYIIAGGSAEIRRNIIAERVLGLPRSY